VVVSKENLLPGERVLIVDDFLANGNAIRGLIDLVNQASGEVVGCTTAIEKGFQGGGDQLRAEGIKVESLAIVDEMTDHNLVFRK
jgi:xanthine phosphoribosyltransferase